MTARIMADSTDWQVVLSAIRSGRHYLGLPVTMAAGYIDGLYTWPARAWADLHAAGLHNRQMVGITVTSTGGEAWRAAVGDEEPGNMDPAQAARWALTEHNASHWPVIYCDRADKPAVIGECGKLGLHPARDYGLWIATLDGSLNDLDGKPLRDEPGVVAIQFLGAAQAGIQADISLVTSSAWRAPAVPKPVPPPPVQVDGYLVLPGAAGGLTGRAVTSADGGKTWG